MRAKMRFLVTGDPQIGHTGQEDVYKSTKRIESMVAKQNEGTIDFALITGDLTQHGSNKINSAKKILCCIGNQTVATKDEFNIFKSTILDPLEKHFPVFLCHGNHDEVTRTSTLVTDFVKKRHGDLHYYKKFVGGLHLLCLGKYANKDTCQWLSQILKSIGTKEPIIIFQHFNFKGSFSDWWTNEEKTNLYNTIKNHNILCIYEGHLHHSYTYRWNGIPVANASGKEFICANYDYETRILENTFL